MVTGNPGLDPAPRTLSFPRLGSPEGASRSLSRFFVLPRRVLRPSRWQHPYCASGSAGNGRVRATSARPRGGEGSLGPVPVVSPLVLFSLFVIGGFRVRRVCCTPVAVMEGPGQPLGVWESRGSAVVGGARASPSYVSLLPAQVALVRGSRVAFRGFRGSLDPPVDPPNRVYRSRALCGYAVARGYAPLSILPIHPMPVG